MTTIMYNKNPFKGKKGIMQIRNPRDINNKDQKGDQRKEKENLKNLLTEHAN